MKKQQSFGKKIEQFYNDIEEKRDLNKIMRLQTDLEFQQNDVRKLNKKYSAETFNAR